TSRWPRSSARRWLLPTTPSSRRSGRRSRVLGCWPAWRRIDAARPDTSCGMTGEIIIPPSGKSLTVPAVIAQAGEDATKRFLECFTATIRNLNTRAAYAQAVKQFLDWCKDQRLGFTAVQPMHVAAYIEQLGRREEKPLSDPSIKQHLAAIKMMFDWMVTGHVL